MRKKGIIRLRSSKKLLSYHDSFEDQITKLFLLIKKDNCNIFQLEEPIIPKQEEMSLINYILHKRIKSKEDREVLIQYLKSLQEFMSIIAVDTTRELLNEMLYRVSKSLNLQECPNNTILFRNGDKGATFYIIFKGSVAVLIAKEVKIQLSLEEYLTHLFFLNQMEEFYLQQKTALANSAVYDICLTNPARPYIKNLANKSLENYIPKDITYNSLEEYMDYLIPISSKEHNPFFPPVSICIYHKVAVLTQGNTFGETALLSKNSLRTATIFITEDTSFGILNEMEFRMSLRNNQVQTKKERIQFVMSFNLFNQISYELFLSKYWNYFAFIRLEQNEVLFSQNNKRELIYLLKEGEIELSSWLSMDNINKLLIQFGDRDKTMNECYKFNHNTSKKMKIAIMKHKTILGLDDLVYGNEQLFCTATCVSKKAELFIINYKMMLEVIDFCRTNEILKAIVKERINLMLSHLKAFKKVGNFALEKEPYSVIKDKILPVFNNRLSTTKNRAKKTVIIKTNMNKNINSLYQKKSVMLVEQKMLQHRMSTRNQLPSPYFNNNTIEGTSAPISYNNRHSSKRNTHSRQIINTDFDSNIITNHHQHNNDIPKNKHRILTGKSSHRNTIRASIMRDPCLTQANTYKSSKSTKRMLKLSTGETEDSETDSKLNQIANRIKSGCPKNKLIYSNLILQSDFTISSTYDIGNIMDFCLMEEDKQQTSPFITNNTPREAHQFKANYYSPEGSVKSTMNSNSTSNYFPIGSTSLKKPMTLIKPRKGNSRFFNTSGF